MSEESANYDLSDQPLACRNGAESPARKDGSGRSHLRSLKVWLVTHLLPEALLYPLWRWYTARTPRTVLPTARDHRVLPIQDGVRLEVYWASPLAQGVGPGPKASLFVSGDEVLRLDCFGGKKGHYHINPRQTHLHVVKPVRLYFPEGSYEEHIDRAAFELARNLPAALAMNRDSRIRRIQLDDERLVHIAREMRTAMLELLAKHREELPDSS